MFSTIWNVIWKWLSNQPSTPPPPTPVDPDPVDTVPVPPDGLKPTRQQLLDAHNRARQSNGLPALKLHEQLNTAAQNYAAIMAGSNQLSHTVHGTTFMQRIRDEGYRFAGGGENIALGQRNVDEVMRSWLNSSGHRANILNRSYIHVGFGLYIDKQGRHWWCADFAAPGRARGAAVVHLSGPLFSADLYDQREKFLPKTPGLPASPPSDKTGGGPSNPKRRFWSPWLGG